MELAWSLKPLKYQTNADIRIDLATAAKHSVVQRFPPGFRSSPFAGPPSEELDAAWHGLFERTFYSSQSSLIIPPALIQKWL